MASSAKAKQSNGAGKKPKAAAAAPSTGTSTPVTTTSTVVTSVQIELAAYGTGKPEKSLYDAEQNKIKAEIEALQVRLVRNPLIHESCLSDDPHFATTMTECREGQALRRKGWPCPRTEEAAS